MKICSCKVLKCITKGGLNVSLCVFNKCCLIRKNCSLSKQSYQKSVYCSYNYQLIEK